MLLLTGATGFLGSRLCAEILRRTDQQVICLVRAASAAEAEERVRGRLRWQDPDLSRSPWLLALPGDFTLPRFGLGQDGYRALAASVTEVYHCGASVNMAAAYGRLAPVNVTGTSRIVEFCETTERPELRRLHHISTLSVFLTGRRDGRDIVREHAMPTERTCGEFGYPKSKYEAERIVAAAAARGLPATVYRPGLILADSRDGACPREDFVACLYAAAILTACSPDSDSRLPVIAADHAAQLIAVLSLAPAPRARPAAYPVTRTEPFAVREFFDQARAFGYPLTAVSAQEWSAALRRHRNRRPARALRALTISRYLLGLSPETRLPEVECTETVKIAADARIAAPPMDRAYFSRIFRHLIDHAVIPRPSAPKETDDRRPAGA